MHQPVAAIPAGHESGWACTTPWCSALQARHVIGDADGQIVRFATEDGHELIVMGTHGRSRWRVP